MSITHDHGDIVFQCDGKGCHQTLQANTSNFESAQNMLRRNGWKPRRAGAEWKHYCRPCVAVAADKANGFHFAKGERV